MTFNDDMPGLLVFELTNEERVIQIHGNTTGLRRLVQFIQQSIDFQDHQHLMSPSWGGNELNEEAQGFNSTVINRVDIHCWRDENEGAEKGPGTVKT